MANFCLDTLVIIKYYRHTKTGHQTWMIRPILMKVALK